MVNWTAAHKPGQLTQSFFSIAVIRLARADLRLPFPSLTFAYSVARFAFALACGSRCRSLHLLGLCPCCLRSECENAQKRIKAKHKL